MSGLPPEIISAARLAHSGRAQVPAESLVEVIRSCPQSHVKAIRLELTKQKGGKHFDVTIENGQISWTRDAERIVNEARYKMARLTDFGDSAPVPWTPLLSRLTTIARNE